MHMKKSELLSHAAPFYEEAELDELEHAVDVAVDPAVLDDAGRPVAPRCPC